MSEYSPEVEQQLTGVAADLGAGPQASPDILGAQMAASGAQPGEVDAAALLAHIRAMQDRLDALEAEKTASVAPEVVKYAQAILDHITAKLHANPGLADHPDLPLKAGVTLAGKVVSAAEAEVAGTRGALAGPLADLTAWVRAHAARFSVIDWHYVLQLAEEAAVAAAKLAA